MHSLEQDKTGHFYICKVSKCQISITCPEGDHASADAMHEREDKIKMAL